MELIKIECRVLLNTNFRFFEWLSGFSQVGLKSVNILNFRHNFFISKMPGTQTLASILKILVNVPYRGNFHQVRPRSKKLLDGLVISTIVLNKKSMIQMSFVISSFGWSFCNQNASKFQFYRILGWALWEISLTVRWPIVRSFPIQYGFFELVAGFFVVRIYRFIRFVLNCGKLFEVGRVFFAELGQFS